MKCWINGEVCPTFRDRLCGGILDSRSNACRYCHILRYNAVNLGNVLDEMGIYLDTLHPEIIEEQDQQFLRHHAKLIVKALEFFNKNREPEKFFIDEDGSIIDDVVKIFKAL